MFLNSAQNCKCKYTTNNNADNDDARFFLAKRLTEDLSNGRAVEQSDRRPVGLSACKPVSPLACQPSISIKKFKKNIHFLFVEIKKSIHLQSFFNKV